MIRAQTPRRWGLGNPAEETFCHPNQKPQRTPQTELHRSDEGQWPIKNALAIRNDTDSPMHGNVSVSLTQWRGDGSILAPFADYVIIIHYTSRIFSKLSSMNVVF
jgi:hypothetical protein